MRIPGRRLRHAVRRRLYEARLAVQGPLGAGRAPMRHAGPAALDRLEPLLAEIRAIPDLVEKSRGVFYRRSQAWLHFHEDPTGLHADLRDAKGDFERIRVEETDERTAFLGRIKPL
jgi:hypothetical protein